MGVLPIAGRQAASGYPRAIVRLCFNLGNAAIPYIICLFINREIHLEIISVTPLTFLADSYRYQAMELQCP
jgi:hypothetical protein